ncbi:MAG: hypothetical protein J2P17_32135, partial [Mycobacterium sp.]|nr:hypothetical protein [Mycobacterium sp.]
LLTAVGELCQVAGWVASDAGNRRDAARYYLAGVKAAHAADDRALGANLLSSLAYQETNQNGGRSALLLAASAATGAPKAAPTARALFQERVAWAAANTGDHHTAGRALAEVERLYDQRRADVEPEWTYWLNPDEIDVMAARCFVALKRPEAAIPKLSDVLSHYDPSLTRERALYLSWLAEACIQTGDLDHAVTVATECLELSDSTNSSRTTDRVQHLRQLLQQHASVACVRDFLDRTMSGPRQNETRT